MTRALEELIDSSRSVCEDPRKFIENKLFDTLKALKPASETWLFLKDALVLQGASAEHATVKLGKDKFEVVAIYNKHRDLIKEYSFVELPDDNGLVTLDDFGNLLKDCVFEFGFSESKPKTYFKNFLDEVKNARKQDVTTEFKQDLDNSLLSMYAPIAAATGRKNFAKVVGLLKEHEPELYDILKATCNIKFNSPENIANTLYDNLNSHAKQILLAERKEHKKELAEIIDLPVYTRVANVAKNVVANGLIWTPILATIAGMAGLIAIAPHAAAQNSPEKTSSRDITPVKITDGVGDELFWGWSPDGKKIVYTDNGDIYAINSDGSRNTKLVDLVNDTGYIKYSPNGHKFAFVENLQGPNALYIANSDGTNIQKISTGAVPSGSGMLDFWWSPDSTKLAFYGYGPSSSDLNLWVMDLQSGKAVRAGDFKTVVDVAWNSNNNDLAYVAVNENAQKAVCVARGSPQTGYTFYQLDAASDYISTYENHLGIGNQVFWIGSDIYYSYFGNIVRSNGDVGNRISITDFAVNYNIHGFSLSPDKTKFALYTDNSEFCHVYVVNKDGSQLKRIADIYSFDEGEFIQNIPPPVWNSKSDLLAFNNIAREISDSIFYVNRLPYDTPTKVLYGDLFGFSGVAREPIWSPVSNDLAFLRLSDGSVYALNINPDDLAWTNFEQLRMIGVYAPHIIHDSRPDTTATQTYLPADPRGDNTDVTDNRENYDADASKFSVNEKDPVYVKVTEYPEEGYDIYTYIYYRTNNPHWVGLEAFKHEHDVQRVHVKVSRAGGPMEIAYSQHNWMVNHPVTDTTDLVLYSEWGGHEYWKFVWSGANGKGQESNDDNCEFRPLDEIVISTHLDADDCYKTDENHAPWSPPPKGPWLYKDVQDPKSAFEPFGGKAGVFTAELQSPGELSVILDGSETGATKSEILYSAWQNNAIGILGVDQNDTPTLKILGTENGTYGISGTLAADKAYAINVADIPIEKGETHTYKIQNWKDYADGKSSIEWTIQKDGKTYSKTVSASEITAENYDKIIKSPPNGNNTTQPSDNTPLIIGAGVGIGVAAVAAGGYLMMRRRRQQPPMQATRQSAYNPRQELSQQPQTPASDMYAGDYEAGRQDYYSDGYAEPQDTCAPAADQETYYDESYPQEYPKQPEIPIQQQDSDIEDVIKRLQDLKRLDP